MKKILLTAAFLCIAGYSNAQTGMEATIRRELADGSPTSNPNNQPTGDSDILCHTDYNLPSGWACGYWTNWLGQKKYLLIKWSTSGIIKTTTETDVESCNCP